MLGRHTYWDEDKQTSDPVLGLQPNMVVMAHGAAASERLQRRCHAADIDLSSRGLQVSA